MHFLILFGYLKSGDGLWELAVEEPYSEFCDGFLLDLRSLRWYFLRRSLEIRNCVCWIFWSWLRVDRSYWIKWINVNLFFWEENGFIYRDKLWKLALDDLVQIRLFSLTFRLSNLLLTRLNLLRDQLRQIFKNHLFYPTAIISNFSTL